MIGRMTIARDSTSQPGFYGDESGVLRWWDGAAWTPEVRPDGLIPESVRTERLDAQIRSFGRAGYQLETRSGMQAVVIKPRERRAVRDAVLTIGTLGLAALPALLGTRRVYHRVVITVDPSGAVRLA